MKLSSVLSSMLVFGLSASALAGPVTYAGRRQSINAAVLLVGSQTFGGEPINIAPHVWGQLEKDRGIKPPSWTFVNPRALTTLTADAQTRWNTFGVTDMPNLGGRLTKDDSAYWELNLASTSDFQIGTYDILLLPVAGNISLNPAEREKLRKFVDKGGILWVDVNETIGTNIFSVLNPLPIPLRWTAGGGTLLVNPSHPLMSSPNTVGYDEVAALQRGFSGSFSALSAVANPLIQSWMENDSYKIDPVVGENSDSITVGLGKIGDGYMLVTTRGVSTVLNQGKLPNGTIDPAGNRTFKSLPPIQTTAYRGAAKILVNAISLRSEYTTESSGGRRTSAIGSDLSAPLLRRFQVNTTPNTGTTPAISDGVIYVSSGSRLIAMETDPNLDRDGDGNPDDGIVDPDGAQYDIIWSQDLGTTVASSPTIATLPRTSGDATPVVMVQTNPGGNGLLRIYRTADGVNVADIQAPSGTNAPSASLPGGAKPPASPTVHEGLVYVADIPTINASLGRVWVADLATLAPVTGPTGLRWRIEAAPRMGAVDGSPTVGYIPIQDNSGGTDRVLYVPTAPDANRSAGFVSLWLGARGEAPTAISISGADMTVTTRAALQNLPVYVPGPTGNPSQGVKISVVDPTTGQPYSDVQTDNIFTGSLIANVVGQNGVLRLTLTGFGQSLIWTGPNQNAALRIDYSVDWGTGAGGGAPDNFVRGDIQFPDELGNPKRILGGLALAPNGNLFAVVAPMDPAANGGSLFCLREEGRGDFKVLYRWEAFDQIQLTSSGAGGVTTYSYDAAVIDYDGLLDIIPFLRARMTNLKFITGPVLSGNRVYAALNSTKAIGFIPVGNPPDRYTATVMAFEANPQPAEILVENLLGQPIFLQADPGRSTNKVQPNVTGYMQPQQYQYEQVGSFGKYTFNTLSGVTRGRIRDCLISNMPIAARRGGSGDITIMPDSGIIDGAFTPGNADGRWNPHRYQIVINGMEARGQLFASGDTLYVGGGSYLPGILNSPAFPVFVKQSFMYAIDTKIAPNDLKSPAAKQPFQLGPLRPWEKYHSILERGTGGPMDVEPSKYVLWPSAFGIRTFNDLQVRVNQAALSGNYVEGMAGGNGIFTVWEAGQMTAYSRSDLLVADEGRIIRVDPSGFPYWMTDSTYQAGEEGSISAVSDTVLLSKPSRAYTVGGNAYLVADPGNSRIVRIDNTGRELRTITGFRIDPIFRPQGVLPNVTTKLSSPRDVKTFTTFQPNSGVFSPALQRQMAGTAEYWVHYIVADTGNQRVVELIDRYEYDSARGVIGRLVRYDDPMADADPIIISGIPRRLVPAIGILKWQIRSELTKKNYSYNSIDSVYLTPTGGGAKSAVYAFGFGNVTPSPTSFARNPVGQNRFDNPVGAGGIVVYDEFSGRTDLITDFYIPAIGANVFWNDAAIDFNSAAVPADTVGRKISGLRSASISFTAGQLAVMFTDNTGVYEVVKVGNQWVVRWMMLKDNFIVMRRSMDPGDGLVKPTTKNPMGFLPTYARRLNSGQVIITNGYIGSHRIATLPYVGGFGISPNDPYNGEVVVLEGDLTGTRAFDWNKPNFGFDSYTVDYELPPVAGTRGIVGPAFAEKK